MDASDDATLLSVASSISNGSQVDWARLQNQQSDAHQSQILAEMAVIDQIAAFHRTAEPSEASTAERPAGASDPGTWGHFTIFEALGHGAFGTVYRALDQKLQSEVALKLSWPLVADGETDSATVLKEARLLARLRHPNVVRVLGTDHIEGRVGIWMEFVKGRTLGALLKEQGPFSAREAAGIGFDVCRALAAVHRAGVLHGDIKAHNVMREHGGRTVLTDFGTGKELGADSTGDPSSPDLAGTPLYLAPEVFEGRPRTALADIYGVGVLLYHLVTASYPVTGRTRAEVADAHQRGTRTSLRDARPDLPPEFVAVVERALAVDPQERYQSAGAFEAALAPIIGRTPDEPPRPRWVPIALSATALVVAGGAAFWVFAPGVRIERPVEKASLAGRPTGNDPTYQIDTALYRMRGAAEERLRPGGDISPGDTLFAKVRVSVPAYVYIVNEDEQGESYVLFPLPGQALTNPLQSGTTHRIPGASGDALLNWQVTSAGGREHFLVFASPEQLPVFEQMFAALPKPELGRQVRGARLSPEAIGRLRSVGGLASAPATQPTSMRLSSQFATPLGEGEETAQGLWVRQFTLNNPR